MAVQLFQGLQEVFQKYLEADEKTCEIIKDITIVASAVLLAAGVLYELANCLPSLKSRMFSNDRLQAAQPDAGINKETQKFNKLVQQHTDKIQNAMELGHPSMLELSNEEGKGKMLIMTNPTGHKLKVEYGRNFYGTEDFSSVRIDGQSIYVISVMPKDEINQLFDLSVTEAALHFNNGRYADQEGPSEGILIGTLKLTYLRW